MYPCVCLHPIQWEGSIGISTDLILGHLNAVGIHVQDRSLLWAEVSVSPLHKPLQGAVALLTPGERVQGGDLFPRFVVGEGEGIGVLVLKEAVEIPGS